MNTTTRPIVPGIGPFPSSLAIVGEAPGAQEAREGTPFVGPSGKLLTDLLHASNILRQDCYLTNVIKEHPERNNILPYIDITAKVPKLSPEYHYYLQELKKELQEIQPNLILAVGNIALFALTGKKGILNWRGSILESTLLPGTKVLPVIHPAAALRQYELTHFLRFDLRKAAKEKEDPTLPTDETNYILKPSFEESCAFLEGCKGAEYLAFDIEVSYGHVSCISFATSTEEVISIPFTEGNQEYFIIPQEAYIWKLIGELLEDPSITKVAQNAMFDTSFLFSMYGIKTRNIEDTMIAQAILYPDFPKSLAFITSTYTNFPYYKDEGKEKIYNKGGSDIQFWQYNARDSIVLLHALPKMLKDLERQGNLETYQKQRDLILPLLFMSQKGLNMDGEGLKRESEAAEITLKELRELINTLVGYELNPNSPAQLKEYFYVKAGCKPHIVKGSISTDDDALKKLCRNSNKTVATVAKTIQAYRKLGKMNGTYYKMKLDGDGRLRCSMNPVGTRMGRLSSRKTIFGTGANLQNQPYKMKKYMLPDPGYVLYDIDLSQAENRVVALLAGDPKMLTAFSDGTDIHSLTASLIFGKDIAEISSAKGSSTLGSGDLSERDWGKKANHGLNYGMAFRKAALLWEIPEAEARFIVEKYHTAYPYVRQWHNQIEEQLKSNRTLTNLYGRKYQFWDRWDSSLLLAAYAFQPQSSIADKINRDGVLELYYDDESFKEVEFLLQVHDSIVFQIPISTGWERQAEILLDIKARLERPLTYKSHTITIPAEITLKPVNMLSGWDLLENKTFPSHWENPSVLAAQLEREYLKLIT